MGATNEYNKHNSMVGPLKKILKNAYQSTKCENNLNFSLMDCQSLPIIETK